MKSSKTDDFFQKNKAVRVSDAPPLTIHQERRYLSASVVYQKK